MIRAAGASEAELALVNALDELVLLSADVGARPAGAPMSARGLAAATDDSVERIVSVLRLAGLPCDDPDAMTLFDSDAHSIATVLVATELLGATAVEMLMHRTTTVVQQLAHAISTVFRVNVLGAEAIVDPAAAVERNLGSSVLIDAYVAVLAQLLRHHLRATFRLPSHAVGSLGEMHFMGVAFVDLAASSEVGERVSAEELSGLMHEFTSESAAVATATGARLVKTIGDEAMIVADNPAAACRAAIELVSRYRDHSVVSSARAGVAAGDLLDQDGDCYGPVVNRAARFVEAAADGTVVCDRAVVEALAPGEFIVDPLAAREFRGIGAHDWFTVTRSA